MAGFGCPPRSSPTRVPVTSPPHPSSPSTSERSTRRRPPPATTRAVKVGRARERRDLPAHARRVHGAVPRRHRRQDLHGACGGEPPAEPCAIAALTRQIAQQENAISALL